MALFFALMQRCTNGRDRKNRPVADRIPLLIGAVLARQSLPTISTYLAGVPGAWPTPHGHRRVLQPGRSWSPGHMLVDRRHFSADATYVVALAPCFFIFFIFFA